MNEVLHDITLRNFRSYSEASYEFESGVNIIVGPNASGKTNLLEAVHCIFYGKGLRGSDSGLIRHNSTWLRVDSHVGDNERKFILEKDQLSSRSKKRYEINNKQLKRLDFDTILPVVVFQPDDLRLTSGSPERRRDYIDKLLTQTTPSYKSDLLAYERILKQRNVALKNDHIDSSQLFAWNIQLADKGARIATSRNRIIDELNKKISAVYSDVAGSKNAVKLNYYSNIPLINYSENLLNQLDKNYSYDQEKGITSAGPHRDDIVITINHRNIKDVASRGENRTFVLALKIIELDMLENVHDKKPLILLDDVFSELDGLRRKLLTSHLKNKQTIITTTDADIVVKNLSHANLIAI